MKQVQVAIGIDIGGTGMKGAAVDTATGELVTMRREVPTPAGGRIADVVREIATLVTAIHADVRERTPDVMQDPRDVPIGVALPGAIRDGRMLTAFNIDREWIGADASGLLADALQAPCAILNDADAAGIAEAACGAAYEVPGTVLLLTFGTGIGSALISNGALVPNLELGHLELGGHPDIEKHVAASVIAREGLSLDVWAERVTTYLSHLELLFSPERFVVGGGISAILDDLLPLDGVHTPVVPARFAADSGITGAALHAGGR